MIAQAEVGLVHGSGFSFDNGAQVLSAGSEFNTTMAYALWARNCIEKIICSGRGPVGGVNYRMTEAELMAVRLKELGVPSRLIETEEVSTSTVGNWSLSAEIISALEAESVLGFTAGQNIPRMYMIGQFVAKRSDFELVGYQPSGLRARPKDHARELIMGRMTKRFLDTHTDTSVSELAAAYDVFKSKSGLGAMKRLMHRRSTRAIRH